MTHRSLRDFNDPSAAGSLDMGESIFGEGGSTEGGFVVAIQPGGPGYLLASDVPTILNGTHQQPVASSTANVNLKRTKSTEERKYTRKPKASAVPLQSSGEVTATPPKHTNYAATKRDPAKYTSSLVVFADELLSGQSAWCHNCISPDSQDAAQQSSNSPSTGQVTDTFPMLDDPMSVDDQRNAVVLSVAEECFREWRAKKKFSDPHIDDAMIVMYLQEEIVRKGQKKRGRLRKTEKEAVSEGEGEREIVPTAGGHSQANGVVYAVLDLWQCEYNSPLLPGQPPKSYWNFKITETISAYLDTLKSVEHERYITMYEDLGKGTYTEVLKTKDYLRIAKLLFSFDTKRSQ
ncbi:UNVERIFIED_CONTAM: hypothetical protein HDU68_000291, partial [Siphonaria sp. JEL0065]